MNDELTPILASLESTAQISENDSKEPHLYATPFRTQVRIRVYMVPASVVSLATTAAPYFTVNRIILNWARVIYEIRRSDYQITRTECSEG